MAKAGQAQEPSMEEILASIRRIISDDDAPQDNAAGAGEAEGDVDMGADMSQDDLDKLFDSDGGGFDVDDVEMETVVEEEPAEEEEELVAEEEADKAFDLAAMEAEEEDEADTSDVLELTEDLATEGDENAPDMVEGLPDDTDTGDLAFVAEDEAVEEESVEEAFEEPAPQPEPVAAKPAFTDYKPVREDAGAVDRNARLVSDMTDSAVNSAFANLSNTVLSANSRTLDELVREMLRPMIKGWLDDNLPIMVERMVRQEIERVTRGR
ncbi:DUF2497 domain-containing protein [Breoghania sp.]|uniref:PopZ family protein n=1 Tax=Breoghania sp. TaxID=2065378 RepID=UPI002AA5E992|nr:DUF2497 domain-containing protein [Breoghania sp.]